MDEKLPTFIMNENYLDYPMCTHHRLYSVLLRDPIERVKSHEKHLDYTQYFRSLPYREKRLQLIRNNYMTWALASGATKYGNRISLIPQREHLEIAKETLAQLDFILELTNNQTCNQLILNIMGFSGYELPHKNEWKGKKRVLPVSDQRYKEYNQLDVELYDYAHELMKVDCEFFTRVERKLLQIHNE